MGHVMKDLELLTLQLVIVLLVSLVQTVALIMIFFYALKTLVLMVEHVLMDLALCCYVTVLMVSLVQTAV